MELCSIQSFDCRIDQEQRKPSTISKCEMTLGFYFFKDVQLLGAYIITAVLADITSGAMMVTVNCLAIQGLGQD